MLVDVCLCMHRRARAADPQSVSNRVSVCSLLVELAWKEAAAAGKLDEAGEGIRSAVHPRYLGDVADEPVVRDVPANMCDRTSKTQAAAEDNGQRLTIPAMSVSA
jgi:hypothetical protein